MAAEAVRETYVSVYAPVVVGERTLLAYNARGPYRGTWGLPGGGIEFGETPEEAIHRELWEEVGTKVETVALIDVHSHRLLFERTPDVWIDFHHIALLYRATFAVPLSEQIASPDSSERLVWHRLEELETIELSPCARYALTAQNEQRPVGYTNIPD